MMIPDNFRMATLLPAAAILPSLPAEPVSWLRMVENVSDCMHGRRHTVSLYQCRW